jgi:hypothetical protein
MLVMRVEDGSLVFMDPWTGESCSGGDLEEGYIWSFLPQSLADKPVDVPVCRVDRESGKAQHTKEASYMVSVAVRPTEVVFLVGEDNS